MRWWMRPVGRLATLPEPAQSDAALQLFDARF